MWVKRNTELCTFCTETKESLVHIFWEYNHVRKFWLVIDNIFEIQSWHFKLYIYLNIIDIF
jgi:hypothetical protein